MIINHNYVFLSSNITINQFLNLHLYLHKVYKYRPGQTFKVEVPKLSTSVQLLSTIIRQSWINQTLITRIAFSNDMIEVEGNTSICWFSILTTYYFCWAYPLSSRQVFSLFFLVRNCASFSRNHILN